MNFRLGMTVFEAYNRDWLRGLGITCATRWQPPPGACWEMHLSKEEHAFIISVGVKDFEEAPPDPKEFFEELGAELKTAVEYLEPNKFAHLRGGRG